MISDLEVASLEDLEVAKISALIRAGCTAEELIKQKENNNFNSMKCRLAWIAIGDLL